MRIKFKKDCPWLQEGRIHKYEAAAIRDIKDHDALEMIRCGYAEETGEEEEEFSSEPGNEEEFDKWKRREFYADYSRTELQEICKNIPEYRTHIHKNIADLIDLILAHEKDHEILKEN
jgi:hypothetical protein